MSDISDNPTQSATAFWKVQRTQAYLGASALLALGMIAGGYLMGDGLLRAKMADRSVTVRGLAERDVMADLATWTISFSSTATNLATAQEGVDRDSVQLHAFFKELGFPEDALQPVGVNVQNSTGRDGITRYTVRQRMSLRTRDIELAQKAARRQSDLVRRGVVLEQGSGMSFSFTKLNDVKPEMVAEATRNARESAQQFAQDSGAGVGSIRRATQGYFSVSSRDGESNGWDAADTPFKKVRVVTTVDFMLD